MSTDLPCPVVRCGNAGGSDGLGKQYVAVEVNSLLTPLVPANDHGLSPYHGPTMALDWAGFVRVLRG